MNIRFLKLMVAAFFITGVITGSIAGCSEAPSPAEVTQTLLNAKVIATGANISGANGIHFGPDGLLYVASVIGSELLAIDPANGEIKHRWNSEQGVEGPDDRPSLENVMGFTPGPSVAATTRSPSAVNPATSPVRMDVQK